MRPIVTERVVWSVCRSVSLYVIVVSPAKMAEAIDMPFGMWTRVDPRKHALDGVHIDATWRIRVNRPCAVAMRSYIIMSNYSDQFSERERDMLSRVRLSSVCLSYVCLSVTLVPPTQPVEIFMNVSLQFDTLATR